MGRSATIGDLITRMEEMQVHLDASGDGRRHWRGVYRRGTVAVSDEIRRGGFLDSHWVERWDLAVRLAGGRAALQRAVLWLQVIEACVHECAAALMAAMTAGSGWPSGGSCDRAAR